MTHTVKSGDTLSKIATRNGLTLAQLLDANPKFKANPNSLKVGDKVEIPGSQPEPLGQPQPGPQPQPNVQPSPHPAPGFVLGKLSAKFETGGRGPGTVSTGAGDFGGVSYGSYQMASKMGVPTKFVTQAGFPWRQDFVNLTAGAAGFTAVWKRIAAEQTDDFQ